MNKYLFILIIIVFFSLFIISVMLNYKQVCINNKCFEVEVVRSQKERSKGLMYRKELPLNSGMLFIFDKEENHSFWMKNTLIPLDIIWINKNKEIVHIYKDAQPNSEESINPGKDSLYVLEINAGEADFEIGDKVIFK